MLVHIVGGSVIDTDTATFGPFGVRIPGNRVPDGLEGPNGSDLLVPWSQVTGIHASATEFTESGLL